MFGLCTSHIYMFVVQSTGTDSSNVSFSCIIFVHWHHLSEVSESTIISIIKNLTVRRRQVLMELPSDL